MSLTAFLRAQFLEYAQTHSEDVRLCFNINSMYKHPTYYYSVYHDKESNQLIVEGYCKPKDRPVKECLLIYENAAAISLEEFLMDKFYLTSDPTDIHIQGQEAHMSEILNEKVVHCEHKTIWICN